MQSIGLSDPATQTCVNNVSDKTIAAIDKVCVGEFRPDCTGPDSNDYKDGATWTNQVNVAINGNAPNTRCEGNI